MKEAQVKSEVVDVQKLVNELDELICALQAPKSEVEFSNIAFSELPKVFFEFRKSFAQLIGDDFYDDDMADFI